MLVAEKQQYLESYDPRRHEKIRVVEKPKVVPQPKVKQRNKVLPVLAILVGFAACSTVVARYAMIAQNQADILKLEQVLEEELKKEDRLKLQLNYSGDLKRIEEYAKNNLGMNYPDDSQVRYVELPQQDQSRADETNESLQMVQQDEETLWDKIASLLD